MGGRKSKMIAALSAQVHTLQAEISKLRTSTDRTAEVAQLIQRIAELEANQRQLEEYRAQHAVVDAELAVIGEEMQRLEIREWRDLERVQAHQFENIVRLCQQLPAIDIPGRNIGFFGSTSVGKSTIINQCIGRPVCAVGYGETTREMTPYRDAAGTTYWDMPGRNDEISYFTAEFIGVLRGLSFIGIVVTNTTRDMSRMIDLIERLQLRYHIIVNKIDQIEQEADRDQNPALVEGFMQQIREEVAARARVQPQGPMEQAQEEAEGQPNPEPVGDARAQNATEIFFLSAVNPRMGDWERFIHFITAPV